MEPEPDRVTRCIERLRQGDRVAFDELLPQVYGDLRRLARTIVGDRFGLVTLEPTALVHECYARLVGSTSTSWNDRKHFFHVAALAMRQLLANRARSKRSLRAGGAAGRVTLHEEVFRTDGRDPDSDVDLIALDDALTKLAGLDARQARIVELRFLAGLTVEEAADLLGVSERTVYLDWQMARAWLARELA